eukprot:CAMPEP_0182477990 /NCGR_PEP_ID=MMETSP1319-20130603/31778_1 /TAXON_ID=172717 /ORGANISM="Bolidomonas pacifica, Strain RCC208" /LENGTH=66 /DNA_ID=CAMNT_0024679281 /DNA_START=21 /DNA_END=221 /DNA_ORIENTATION=+
MARVRGRARKSFGFEPFKRAALDLLAAPPPKTLRGFASTALASAIGCRYNTKQKEKVEEIPLLDES